MDSPRRYRRRRRITPAAAAFCQVFAKVFAGLWRLSARNVCLTAQMLFGFGFQVATEIQKKDKDLK